MNTLQTVQEGQLSQGAQVSQAIEGFILSSDIRLKSRKTYSSALQVFFNWVQDQGLSPADLSKKHIIAFKEAQIENNKATTVDTYLTAVRRFYEDAEAKKLYPNIAKGVKGPKKEKKFKKSALAIQEIASLLTHFRERAESEQTEAALRDYAMINLMLRTGMRTIEVSRAQIGDIIVKNGKKVLLVQRKGRDEKDKWVKLTEKAIYPILTYFEARGHIKPSEPLFPGIGNRSKGKHLTTRTISCIAKEGLRAIGIDSEKFTAHSLRHTFATALHREGVAIEDIQLELGHESSDTTRIYLRSFEEETRLEKSVSDVLDSVF